MFHHKLIRVSINHDRSVTKKYCETQSPSFLVKGECWCVSVGGPIRNVRDSWKRANRQHPNGRFLTEKEGTIRPSGLCCQADDKQTTSVGSVVLFDAACVINSSRRDDPKWPPITSRHDWNANLRLIPFNQYSLHHFES